MGADTGPVQPMRLPDVIPSVRLRQPTPFGNMHLHISVEPDTGREREVFAQLGKGGDLANSDLEAICRLVSLLLRSDGSLATVIDQLGGIGSSLSVPSKDGRIKSLGDGLAQALRKYLAVKEREGLSSLLAGRVKTLDAPESTSVSPGDGGPGEPFQDQVPRLRFVRNACLPRRVPEVPRVWFFDVLTLDRGAHQAVRSFP